MLVRAENILDAAHLTADAAETLGRPIIALLDEVLERGREAGAFRADISSLDLHLAVSALANFRVTNEATVQVLFGVSMADERLTHDIGQYVDMILCWLTSPPPDDRADPTGSHHHREGTERQPQ